MKRIFTMIRLDFVYVAFLVKEFKSILDWRVKDLLTQIFYEDRAIARLLQDVKAIQDTMVANAIKSDIVKILDVKFSTGVIYKSRKLTLDEISEEISRQEGLLRLAEGYVFSVVLRRKLVSFIKETSLVISSAKAFVLSIRVEKFLTECASSFVDFAEALSVESKALVVYQKYRVFRCVSHVFEKLTVVLGKKRIFNKMWLYNSDLPKFLVEEGKTFVAYGYSIFSRMVSFTNKNVQVKSRLVYHKYDFLTEIEAIDKSIDEVKLEVYRLECVLWTVFSLVQVINTWKLINKLERCIEILSAKNSVLSEEFHSARDLALVPASVDSSLSFYDYELEIFRFGELFDKLSGVREIYKRLLDIKNTLTSINLDRGYVLSTDVFDPEFYPIVADVIQLFISRENYNKLNSLYKTACYKWMINIIVLGMYTVCNRCLFILSERSDAYIDYYNEQYLKESTSQYKVLSNWCYNMLDNSIKQHLIRRNLTIYSDVVVGFDTEYVTEDWGKNVLLSAQLSFSHVLKLFIPIFKEYDFVGVNTLSSEVYLKAVPKFDDSTAVKNYITAHIAENRDYKFGKHDEIMARIAEYYNSKSSIKNVAVTSSGVNVLFAKSPIKNALILPVEGERLEISFTALTRIIGHNCPRSVSEIALFEEIRALPFESISRVSEVLERLEESWNSKRMKNTETVTLYLSNEKNKDLTVHNYKDKSLARYQEFLVPASVLTNVQPESSLAPLAILAPLGPSLEEGELGGWKNLREKKETLVSVATTRRIYLCAHYNAADLTLLSDWKDVSLRNVDIVKSGYTSLATPVKYKGPEKVYIRDSILLVSATAKSLKAVAYAYGLEKIELSTNQIQNMDILLAEQPSLFKQYAMQDSLITLIHMLFINDFAFKLGALAIPNTLGTLSSKYIKNKWKADKYRGYQIDVNYPLGDVRASHTPKGINFGGTTLEFSNLFIGSYRGGRNEAFKYGEAKQVWHDYDLTSCYSTIMSMMGDPNYELTADQSLAALAENIMPQMGQPDYAKGRWINPNEDIKELNLKQSYSAFKVQFAFPEQIKYPPLPVTLDQSITVYPSSGVTLVTGLELYTAMSILNKTIDKWSLDPKDFFIKVLYGAYIPFKTEIQEQPDGTKSEVMSYSPFFDVIKELQENRRIWKKATGKGSAMERIYKDLGNMLYGKIVCGISNKKVYDARTESTKTMIGNDLSNPILGSWITGYVRALIAELLHKVDLLGGDVVSCTTDGFVCDIENLEQKILENFQEDDSLLNAYRTIRAELSADPSALEVKTKVKGIIQWTTRGQLSLEDTGVPITAATGYQKSRIHSENITTVQKAMLNGNKVLFLHTELSGGKDLYKTDKHVSLKSRQQLFRTIFDSKRFVIQSADSILSTRPFHDISEALLHRKLMSELKTSVYSDQYSVTSVPPSSNSIQETVKFFIRMVTQFSTDVSIKFAVASMLNSIDSSITEKYVLNIFSHYESNQGNCVTKLPIYKANNAFVEALWEKLNTVASSEVWSPIIQAFQLYFDNFSCIPRTPEVMRDQLISELKTIDPRKLSITRTKDKIEIVILK